MFYVYGQRNARVVADHLQYVKIKFCPVCSEEWYNIIVEVAALEPTVSISEAATTQCVSGACFPFVQPFSAQFQTSNYQGNGSPKMYAVAQLTVPIYESSTNRITFRGDVLDSVDRSSDTCQESYKAMDVEITSLLNYNSNNENVNPRSPVKACQRNYKVKAFPNGTYEMSMAIPHPTLTIADLDLTYTSEGKGKVTRKVWADFLQVPRQTYPGAPNFLKELDTVWMTATASAGLIPVTGSVLPIDDVDQGWVDELGKAESMWVAWYAGMDAAGTYVQSSGAWKGGSPYFYSKSTAGGKFAAQLAPGWYTVTVTSATPGTSVAPFKKNVLVSSGMTSSIDLIVAQAPTSGMNIVLRADESWGASVGLNLVFKGKSECEVHRARPSCGSATWRAGANSTTTNVGAQTIAVDKWVDGTYELFVVAERMMCAGYSMPSGLPYGSTGVQGTTAKPTIDCRGDCSTGKGYCYAHGTKCYPCVLWGATGSERLCSQYGVAQGGPLPAALSTGSKWSAGTYKPGTNNNCDPNSQYVCKQNDPTSCSTQVLSAAASVQVLTPTLEMTVQVPLLAADACGVTPERGYATVLTIESKGGIALPYARPRQIPQKEFFAIKDALFKSPDSVTSKAQRCFDPPAVSDPKNLGEPAKGRLMFSSRPVAQDLLTSERKPGPAVHRQYLGTHGKGRPATVPLVTGTGKAAKGVPGCGSVNSQTNPDNNDKKMGWWYEAEWIFGPKGFETDGVPPIQVGTLGQYSVSKRDDDGQRRAPDGYCDVYLSSGENVSQLTACGVLPPPPPPAKPSSGFQTSTVVNFGQPGRRLSGRQLFGGFGGFGGFSNFGNSAPATPVKEGLLSRLIYTFEYNVSAGRSAPMLTGTDVVCVIVDGVEIPFDEYKKLPTEWVTLPGANCDGYHDVEVIAYTNDETRYTDSATISIRHQAEAPTSGGGLALALPPAKSPHLGGEQLCGAPKNPLT